MVMQLQGTKTHKNLMTAFEGESKAAMKYFHFADEAKEKIIEEVFLETMRNEQEHAEIFAEHLGLIGDTFDNLRSAINAETMEANIDYLEFAKTAREEGFEDIGAQFEHIAEIEQQHRFRFEYLLSLLEDEVFYNRTNALYTECVEIGSEWKCMKCGYEHDGPMAPEVCPVCGHKQKYFKVNSRIY